MAPQAIPKIITQKGALPCFHTWTFRVVSGVTCGRSASTVSAPASARAIPTVPALEHGTAAVSRCAAELRRMLSASLLHTQQGAAAPLADRAFACNTNAVLMQASRLCGDCERMCMQTTKLAGTKSKQYGLWPAPVPAPKSTTLTSCQVPKGGRLRSKSASKKPHCQAVKPTPFKAGSPVDLLPLLPLASWVLLPPPLPAQMSWRHQQRSLALVLHCSNQ